MDLFPPPEVKQKQTQNKKQISSNACDESEARASKYFDNLLYLFFSRLTREELFTDVMWQLDLLYVNFPDSCKKECIEGLH